MNNVYLPEEIDSSKCVLFVNNNTLRVYESLPVYDSSINYKDYFLNNHYYYKEDSIIFESGTTLPHCLDPDIFTTDYFYRVDISHIIILWSFVAIFVYFIPLKIWRRLFRRFN